jgi:hypothetical protein
MEKEERKWRQCAFKFLAQQLAKRMCWAVPVQDFAGSVVEHRLHQLDVFARELVRMGSVVSPNSHLFDFAVSIGQTEPMREIQRVGQIAGAERV